jgi:hypothetical protein
MLSRYVGGEYTVFASGRPVQFFDEGFVPTRTTVKECILHAMPGFPRNIADRIERTVQDHIAHDTNAQSLIRTCNLTQLEAEAIVWWTADVSMMSSNMTTEESPYHVFNSILRARGNSMILWRDFSFYFISALGKLPPVSATSFRGETKRAMELSDQYTKGNQVQ